MAVVVYHGTNGSFLMSFLATGTLPSGGGRLGPGTYFAQDKDVAQNVARNHVGAGNPMVLSYLVDITPGPGIVSGLHPAWAGNPPFTEYCVQDQSRILKLVGIEGQLDHTVPAYYVHNIGNPCFLDTHGEKCWVWGDGVTLGTDPGNLQWLFIPVAGEPETFYIIHKSFMAFLDSHGQHVSLWGDGRNIGEAPQNIQWIREPVPNTVQTYYIRHKATNKFLDTHGVPNGQDVGKLQLWDDGVNKGDAPRNLQWKLTIAS